MVLTFSRRGLLVLLGVDCLEYLVYQLYLETKCYRENMEAELGNTMLVFGFGKYFIYSLQNTEALITNDELHIRITTTVSLTLIIALVSDRLR